jgi:DNA modification methylase
MSIVYKSDVNTIYRADARKVAAEQQAGSFSLAVLDGPYAMQKAAWDRMKVSELPEWYSPHFDDVDRLCAASASLYVWNTAEGWATLHPAIIGRGWLFRSLIVWDKRHTPAQIGFRSATAWLANHEVCAFYMRGRAFFDCPSDGVTVWNADSRVTGAERLQSKDYRVRKRGCAPERMPLHACQKPLAFADRIIRASSRPGERVWVPFGGTCREAVAAEWMARAEPDEARQVVTCEIDEDGRDYLGAVVRQLRGEGIRIQDPKQIAMFGGAA